MAGKNSGVKTSIRGLSGNGGETVRRKLLAAPVRVSISGTTAKVAAALAPGDYYVRCDTDAFVKQGIFASVAAATTDNPMTPGEEWVVTVEETGVDDGIAFITTAASGYGYVKAVEAI
jgi:hypothetical protein